MFSGYKWNIKESNTPMGPRDNYFSKDCISVKPDELKLQIKKINGIVYCGEVVSEKSFGYGTYYFYLSSRIDLISPDLVLALFTYKDDNNEIDIEFSKWENPTNQNSQYVLQPSDVVGHLYRFDSKLNGDNTTHIIRWMPGEIQFTSLHGHYVTPPNSGFIINTWQYKKSDVPVPSTEKVRINLWKCNKTHLVAATNKNIDYATIKKFEFKAL